MRENVQSMKEGTWLVAVTREKNQARRVFIVIMYDKYPM
jgi:hypothetical protein